MGLHHYAANCREQLQSELLVCFLFLFLPSLPSSVLSEVLLKSIVEKVRDQVSKGRGLILLQELSDVSASVVVSVAVK